MSKELIETIINGDYVSANELFEERLSIIRERKLYEEKRRLAAKLDEIFGGMSKAEMDARRAAGYRKATEVLGDPDTKTKLSPAAKKYRESLKKKEKGKVAEETIDEAGLAPTDMGKLYRQFIKASGITYKGATGKAQQQQAANPFPTGMGKSSTPSSFPTKSPFPKSMHQTQSGKEGFLKKTKNAIDVITNLPGIKQGAGVLADIGSALEE